MIYKQQMEALVTSSHLKYPIFIPSYSRWNKEDNKTLQLMSKMPEWVQHTMIFVFVREEQYAQYRKSFPNITNIVCLPSQGINGLASTREYMVWYANNVLRTPYFIDMDDDIIRLDYIYTDNGKTSKHTLINEISPYFILSTACLISEYVFNRYPDTVLAGLRRQRFCQGIDNSQTMAKINSGATPRQVMIVNAKRLYEKNIHRNMLFDPTGDDVGFCAEILQNGGTMFNIPCLSYDFVDDSINSVIRNDNNRRQLASYEEACLMLYDFGKYYMKRTFTFDDGSYKFCDIDWKAYHKYKGTTPNKILLEELHEYNS